MFHIRSKFFFNKHQPFHEFKFSRSSWSKIYSNRREYAYWAMPICIRGDTIICGGHQNYSILNQTKNCCLVLLGELNAMITLQSAAEANFKVWTSKFHRVSNGVHNEEDEEWWMKPAWLNHQRECFIKFEHFSMRSDRNESFLRWLALNKQWALFPEILAQTKD